MITFIYGPDYYRVRHESRSIRDAFVREHPEGVTLVTLTLDETVSALERALKHRSLFDGPTLVYAPRVLLGHAEADDIQHILTDSRASILPDIMVVIEESGAAKDISGSSKNLFSFFKKKPHAVLVCQSLSGAELEAWLERYAQTCGAKFGAGAMRALIAVVGTESAALAQEVEKLGSYKRGRAISVQDVSELVVGAAEVNVFDLVDAIATKNKNKAFELLYRSLRLSSDAQRLLAPITYQFRNILLAKDACQPGTSPASFATAYGLHPYVAQKSIAQARHFAPEDIRKLYGQLASIDVEIKSGLGDASLLIHRFLLSL